MFWLSYVAEDGGRFFDLGGRFWPHHRRTDEMTELPENVILDWLGRQFLAHRDDARALRTDMDMLIPLVTRVDHTLDAVREDIRSLWDRMATCAAALRLSKGANRDPYLFWMKNGG
jgi:hypothetical protein